jgi:hypothetical protein
MCVFYCTLFLFHPIFTLYLIVVFEELVLLLICFKIYFFYRLHFHAEIYSRYVFRTKSNSQVFFISRCVHLHFYFFYAFHFPLLLQDVCLFHPIFTLYLIVVFEELVLLLICFKIYFFYRLHFHAEIYSRYVFRTKSNFLYRLVLVMVLNSSIVSILHCYRVNGQCRTNAFLS